MSSLDEHGLFERWDAYNERQMWLTVRSRGGDPVVVERELAKRPEVSPLEALEANRVLVELLTGRRWLVMQAAREAGSSWTEIGTALGRSKQGAQDWYRRKIDHQARYVPDFHDATRAEAVAGDD
jgi:hypothetical protein